MLSNNIESAQRTSVASETVGVLNGLQIGKMRMATKGMIFAVVALAAVAATRGIANGDAGLSLEAGGDLKGDKLAFAASEDLKITADSGYFNFGLLAGANGIFGGAGVTLGDMNDDNGVYVETGYNPHLSQGRFAPVGRISTVLPIVTTEDTHTDASIGVKYGINDTSSTRLDLTGYRADRDDAWSPEMNPASQKPERRVGAMINYTRQFVDRWGLKLKLGLGLGGNVDLDGGSVSPHVTMNFGVGQSN